jgi:hypothetical protein
MLYSTAAVFDPGGALMRAAVMSTEKGIHANA